MGGPTRTSVDASVPRLAGFSLITSSPFALFFFFLVGGLLLFFR
jgi:hypothetical protein